VAFSVTAPFGADLNPVDLGTACIVLNYLLINSYATNKTPLEGHILQVSQLGLTTPMDMKSDVEK